jgi:mannonate dehydratase
MEDLRHFVTITESRYHGLTFCQGSVWEMLSEEDKPQALYDAIEWFGSRGKIFQVHFRNLCGTMTRFVESAYSKRRRTKSTIRLLADWHWP